ncbi:hypothetical protein LTR84_001783 [Exophiala bonariae]|uniref:Thioesterase domain-containing protein n=1 Tax=Exophiala bonariae TaxID=1690606 RepID=A0AAV9NBF5_9EURO|nr:hypothetical protein LTR84_001783 [Exophiala bonariae]
MKSHTDFDIPWCQKLLQSDISAMEVPARGVGTAGDSDISNSMFKQTLYTSDAIRAQVNFKRLTAEADAIVPWEQCFIISIGSGLDGKTGRAHGGFNAMILDQITGSVAAEVSGTGAPATATMTVDYKAAIETPGVILCRGWAVERQGRKTWVKARAEDGQGKVLATAKALFIDPRPLKI